MSFAPPNSRTRSNANTRRRDQNVRTIIDILRNGPMLRDDLRDAMQLSEAGIKKYMTLLCRAGVIHLTRYVNPTRTSPGHPVYRLSLNVAHVNDYLASADAGSEQRDKRKRQTRTIHRMEDDGPFRRGVLCDSIPDPDPVLAHFFGMIQPQATA